jgi:hypothetical protein
VTKVLVGFIIVLFIAVNGGAGELSVQDDPAKTAQQADSATQQQDADNPENTLPTEQQKSPQSEYVAIKKDSPVSTHKVNYFSINRWIGNTTHRPSSR